MFEESLVVTLSEIAEGIEFFQNNTTFHSSSRLLQSYTQAKVKVSGLNKTIIYDERILLDIASF